MVADNTARHLASKIGRERARRWLFSDALENSWKLGGIRAHVLSRIAVGILSLALRTVISRGRDGCGAVEKTLKGILTIGTVLVFPVVVALSLSRSSRHSSQSLAWCLFRLRSTLRIRVSPFFPGPQNSQCKKTLSGERMLEVPIELVQGCQLHTQARMCRMRQSRYAVRFLRLPRDKNLNFLLTSDWLLSIARSWVERFFLCFYATGTCEVFYSCFPHFGTFKWYCISD